MSKIDTLNVQIETAKAELEKAKDAHQASVDALGTASPGHRGTDGQTTQAQAMATAKTTAQLVATATEELALLNQALSAAKAFAASDTARSQKQKARKHMKTSESLMSQCGVAADGIDTALAQLAQANAKWVESCQVLKEELSCFYRITLNANQNARLERMIQMAGLENIVSNAVVCKFDLALAGVNIQSHGRLNYSVNPTSPPEAGKDARIAVSHIMSIMSATAASEGVI